MFNISQDKIRATPVPVPDLGKQVTIASTVMTARAAHDRLLTEIANLHACRSVFLTSLLDQNLEILASYDDLLEKVF